MEFCISEAVAATAGLVNDMDLNRSGAKAWYIGGEVSVLVWCSHGPMTVTVRDI